MSGDDLKDSDSFINMGKWLPGSIIKSDNYLFLSYTSLPAREVISVLYNTLSRNIEAVDITLIKEKNDGIGGLLADDIKFSPRSKVILNGKKYIATWEDAFSFASRINKSKLNELDNKYIWQQNMLDIASGIDEDSNPIITLIEIKPEK